MKEQKIIIRSATEADAPLIANVVAMAIADEKALCAYCGDNYLAVLEEVASLCDTQYSYRNALVADVDGVPSGAIVGYDGALLHPLREGTLAVVEKRTGRLPAIADETEAGEFYLDSLAVMPECRSCGVGRMLISAMCEKAFAEGHERVGLIVDFDNPQAEKLYASLGFQRVGTKKFFGHQMWHSQLKKCSKPHCNA